ncbi:hypothetical protein BD769DRAFT_1399443 [Suillus cothurnatus]|nr:hypothetical protein BD769DRAFT_1399443 [Suillus cothurnatus]
MTDHDSKTSDTTAYDRATPEPINSKNQAKRSRVKTRFSPRSTHQIKRQNSKNDAKRSPVRTRFSPRSTHQIKRDDGKQAKDEDEDEDHDTTSESRIRNATPRHTDEFDARPPG